MSPTATLLVSSEPVPKSLLLVKVGSSARTATTAIMSGIATMLMRMAPRHTRFRPDLPMINHGLCLRALMAFLRDSGVFASFRGYQALVRPAANDQLYAGHKLAIARTLSRMHGHRCAGSNMW